MDNVSLLDVILERASVRKFDKDRKIPKTVVGQILDAGICAPSAGNIQPRTFIVVKDETLKSKLYALCENQAFMKEAPLWIVVCVDLHRHLKAAKLTGVDYDYTGVLPFTLGVLDVGLSLENMVIAAEALGLGSVIIGSIIEHPEETSQILNLPNCCLALSILCIGYPKEKPSTREKWGSEIIACTNEYKEIDANDVLEYWKRFNFGDLLRQGKEPSKEMVKKLLQKGNYGRAYASHYKEGFIKRTNKKLVDFLSKQCFM